MRRARWAAVGLVVVLGGAGGVKAQDTGGDLPVIVELAAPERWPVGLAGTVRLTYRAPQANVVAVVEVVEDADGSGVGRVTRQREVDVVARAFGRESGELTVPFAFDRPGRKRITLTLVTDERGESDPAEVEVQVIPGAGGSE